MVADCCAGLTSQWAHNASWLSVDVADLRCSGTFTFLGNRPFTSNGTSAGYGPCSHHGCHSQCGLAGARNSCTLANSPGIRGFARAILLSLRLCRSASPGSMRMAEFRARCEASRMASKPSLLRATRNCRLHSPLQADPSLLIGLEAKKTGSEEPAFLFVCSRFLLGCF